MPASVDLEKETVITGRVIDGSVRPSGAFVRLLDASDEFTAEVVASATGDFRFFAARGPGRCVRCPPRATATPAWRRPARASTRSTSRSPELQRHDGPAARLVAVVLFFEIMLVAAVVVITWFALYALYRLITDES